MYCNRLVCCFSLFSAPGDARLQLADGRNNFQNIKLFRTFDPTPLHVTITKWTRTHGHPRQNPGLSCFNTRVYDNTLHRDGDWGMKKKETREEKRRLHTCRHTHTHTLERDDKLTSCVVIDSLPMWHELRWWMSAVYRQKYVFVCVSV